MDSIILTQEDRAGAISNGLGHEKRGYAGILLDIRRHEIQASYVRFATTTCIHNESSRRKTIVRPLHLVAWSRANNRELAPYTSLNRRRQPEISILCLMIDRTVFIGHRCEKSLRSDPSREPTEAPTYTLLPPPDPLP